MGRLASGRHCCAEPTAPGAFPRELSSGDGDKTIAGWFTLVCVSETSLSSGSFEQLAIPHFERLYNFACWLTQDRQEAEDLVQETYAKALKGFPSFQPGTNFRAWIHRGQNRHKRLLIFGDSNCDADHFQAALC